MICIMLPKDLILSEDSLRVSFIRHDWSESAVPLPGATKFFLLPTNSGILPSGRM